LCDELVGLLMKNNRNGFSLVEITIVVLAFGIVILGTMYGLRVVQSAKIKAFVVQLNLYQNAATSFRKQYGTWPGDLANARDVLKNCSAARQCINGNGDQIVASANNSTDCRMPASGDSQRNMPCVPGAGSDVSSTGSELIQFWRHLALAGMITDLRMRNDRYMWGDSMPKNRIVGGLQVIYEGNINNGYIRGMTGHIFLLARDVRVLQGNLAAAGNGVLSIEMARAIDTEIDDGFPLSGMYRTIGGWGCGNYGQPGENVYSGTALRQCTSFFKFDP
jgi:type II secretory pathway pseudopilin PulG